MVSHTDDGKRLDVFLAAALSPMSRSLVAQLIRENDFWVEGEKAKPSLKLKAGQRVSGKIPDLRPSPLKPQNLFLDILYEDSDFLVLNKAPGMVVHPAPGHSDGTLVNALLYHCPDLGGIGGVARPGIVHRLDKDTSGVMVAAKNQLSHDRLVSMFHDRKTNKLYDVLVWGEMKEDSGRMEAAIGRHPIDRKRMAANVAGGRDALSFWTVSARYQGLTRLRVDIRSGRTHQIRVHCSHEGHPVVGDSLYGYRKPAERVKDPNLKARLQQVGRQMLHARFLSFYHPVTEEPMVFEAPLPADMADLLRDIDPWRLKERKPDGSVL
ncbi:RluA family pseudouridine synthase [Desulfobotulus sp. H1]|uniref:Pseudouridine synthase n=1 Tax=Desulfobotulus pelophilus TaxID=2823377 RepID=A0ABT3NAR3_9BACT|nr:RluA family pseudouridine synthase [Desulfobotulus pelophilus]